ncbi:MAG TPA: LysM peptidoglycan-binding domain-containing protein [Acidothermaceae bacterium]|jgi:LysM repeat protein|nr:LysM peptidoglycan-binding domain-containing protein [Acidothermaceae bacterium]
MSPQPTLTSPSRRDPARHAAAPSNFVRELAPFEPPRLGRLTVVPRPDSFDTLVISPAPLFDRPAPLRLVDLPATQSSASWRPVPETLTPGHIRLTRRGRLALICVAALCMLFGFSIGNVVSFGSSAPSYPTTPSAGAPTVVVQPGQTLWAIATQVAPHADPRATVQRIIDLNHLAGTNLQVGESLTLPS